MALTCRAIPAQSAGQPAFEVASVKPVPAGSRAPSRMRGGPDSSDPGQITYTNVTLANVLLRAYNIKAYQLSAADWLSTRRYDITARLPPGATPDQFAVMLQNLLAER